MKVSRGNELLRIKVGNRELKEVSHFKYLESVLTRDGYRKNEIKMRIVTTKGAFNREISLFDKQSKH